MVAVNHCISENQLGFAILNDRLGGGWKHTSSMEYTDRSSNGNLKFISLPVIRDDSRQFSVVGSVSRKGAVSIKLEEYSKDRSVYSFLITFSIFPGVIMCSLSRTN